MKLKWFVLLLICVELVTAAQFTVEPVSVVQAEGLEAVFECLYPEATAYSWALNGTFLSAFPPGVVGRTAPSGASPARLTIPATPQYNNTVVQCEAVIREGGGFVGMLSENATLQVQGPLSPVTNLHFRFEQSTNTTITISWTPPFSLNLTTAEPDIQYCVDVYNVINTLVKSVCGITEEVYSFTPSNPSCQQYKFTVTPRSSVEGALNGTTSEPIVGLLAGEVLSFTDQPVSVVQAEGLQAVFECLYPGAIAYSWALTGTFLSAFPPGVVRTAPSGGSPARLTIPTTTQYNSTVVQCEAVIREGGVGVFILSCPAILLVQDPLMAVRNLIVVSDLTTITISWTPPFSLNLTTAEPDIQYCVDVYNVTGGGADLLESVCDITDTSYTFSASDPDQLFIFTVTPRSNVEGSLNGTTSQPVQGYIVGVPLPIPAYQLSVWTNADLNPVVLTFPIKVLGTSPGRMPTSYTVSVNHSLSWCTCPTTHTIANSTVELTLVCAHNCTLSRHQVYSLTVIATNRAGSSHSFPGLHISTHDIENVMAMHYPQQQLLTVQCSYLSGSTVRGVFIIVHSPANNSYHVVYRNDTESVTEFSIASHGLQEHHIAVFDLVGNGLPESVPAATVRASDTNDTITSNTNLPQSLPHSQLESTVTHPSNGVICLSCSFSSAALTGCVGVIHSAKLDNLTLTVLTVDSSGGIDCTVLTEGDYHIAVFGLSVNGLGEFPANQSVVEVLPPIPTQAMDSDKVELSTEVALIAGGTTLGVGVVLLLLCVFTTSTFVCRRRKTLGRFDLTQAQHDTPEGLHEIEGAADRVDWSTAFPGIEQPNEAYSTVMNRNIAYEHTKKPRRQRKRKRQQQPLTPAPEESTHTVVVQYENVTGLQEDHLYEETLPKDTVPVESTVDEVAVGRKETERVHYENTGVRQYTGTKQKYENVCPPTGEVPYKPYVNVDIVD